jgi:predicted transcriptional regulator YdeE
MPLESEYGVVEYPTVYYLYKENEGPIMETAQRTWKEFGALFDFKAPYLDRCTCYKVTSPQLYRAGVLLPTRPAVIPEGLEYAEIPGGIYARFTLHGSYIQLGQASGQIMETIAQNEKLRLDWFREVYKNSPSEVPEEQLITEIYVPIE